MPSPSHTLTPGGGVAPLRFTRVHEPVFCVADLACQAAATIPTGITIPQAARKIYFVSASEGESGSGRSILEEKDREVRVEAPIERPGARPEIENGKKRSFLALAVAVAGDPPGDPSRSRFLSHADDQTSPH
jgi:hypothetical protein